jgi:uncharacterized caspase-like protein
MSMRLGLIALTALWLPFAAVSEAGAGNIALIIGNSAYKNVTKLANPANDAAVVADVFKKAGFEVVESRQNLSVSDMKRVLRDFGDKARDADIAVVYYAGHGIEVEGVNYLVPVDAVLERDADVEDEAVSLDRVLRALDPAKRLRLVILDACRDNPFKQMKRTLGTRSVGRGLAKIEPTNTDTLIAFAAKAGSTASDGDTRNSPFTTALANNIATPGLDLRLALGKVRDEVMKSTNNRQEPFVYGSLGGDTVALVPKAIDPNAEARRDYELAAQVGSKEAWESFLRVHTDGLYANLARAQYTKLMSAEAAQSKAVDAQKHAEDQARAKFEELRRQAAAESAKHESEQAKRKSAEHMQRELEAAKRQLEEAKHQADAARKQIVEARKQGVEDARKQVEEARGSAIVVASAPAGQPGVQTQTPVAPAMDPSDLARLLQAHLKRVGCDPGTMDGGWGDGSRKALETFNKTAGTKFDVRMASLDALDAVRAKTSRVCPLACGKGERIDGERCVAIPAPEPKQKTAATPRRERAAAPAPSGGGHKCFSFNGKRFCE